MSKTVKAQFEWVLSELKKGALAMNVPHGVDVNFRVFGGTHHADLHLPTRTLLALGAERVSYSDGVGLIDKDGSVEVITDHYNMRDGVLINGIALAIGKLAARGKAETLAETWRSQGHNVDIEVQESGEVLLHRHSRGGRGYARV